MSGYLPLVGWCRTDLDPLYHLVLPVPTPTLTLYPSLTHYPAPSPTLTPTPTPTPTPTTRYHLRWIGTLVSWTSPSPWTLGLRFVTYSSILLHILQIFAAGETVKYRSTFKGFANDWIYRTEAKKLMDAIIVQL